MSWLDRFRRRKAEEGRNYKDNLVYLVDKALSRAEELIDSDQVDAFRALHHANKLYDHLEDNYGFDFERNTRLNDLLFTYMGKYN